MPTKRYHSLVSQYSVQDTVQLTIELVFKCRYEFFQRFYAVSHQDIKSLGRIVRIKIATYS
jgi:hypothetical protein